MQTINFKQNNTPESTVFNDIYYNIDNGLEEKHYVFIQGNQLHQKFSNLKNNFNILELGFGTGLSFLLTAIEFSKHNSKYHLNFTSTELYPLDYNNLKKALMVWTDLYNNKLTQDFLAEYKKSDLTKDIKIKIENIYLTILIGDASKTLNSINIKQDCFYLDGFSPAKNPEMWSNEVFTNISRLSNENSTLATYAVSRVVKDIITFAGFNYKKIKGYGKKREMIVGTKNNL